ncbi:tyrosine phosphatase family protein [Curtobacterium sp. PhB130]|uniref:tyrosine-protein phosphatase n=1 Tax=Curtobacterium sp. PhB130 TaxID=2485178 RepID=UPI000F4CD952|nr:tyrosine-protein phosphatase [Curtobacterium sp. PhB130]ROS77889.1 tyrosine phosphatase family protein [Curtobacterium sp. PhB130]
MHDDRTLVADGLLNARDLGGLRTRDGGTTPRGRFFRSESVDRLTDDGWDALRAAGIRTVVDLRTPSERARDTGTRPAWVTTVPVDHDDLDDQAFWVDFWDNGLVGTPLYYRDHLARKPERTVEVLRALAGAEPGGVLFHCAGGRDRTGIVALVLLSIADVDPDEVVADYLRTVAVSDAMYAAIGVEGQEARIEELCAEHGTTVADAFRAVVAGFDVDGFVARSGLTPAELEALRTFRTPLT